MDFQHLYAINSRRRRVKQRDGEMKYVLTVTACIELDAAKPEYDAAKDAALQIAAVNYSRNLGDPFDYIEFEQGDLKS
jgi:hypothetical protein